MSYIKKVISERHRVNEIKYYRKFQRIGDYRGNGFSFPCNKDGSLDKTNESYDYEMCKENLQYCLDHPEEYEDRGCVEETSWHIEPMYVQCSCGEKFYINEDAECVCGQLYNGLGQALLPPKYWVDEYYGYDY